MIIPSEPVEEWDLARAVEDLVSEPLEEGLEVVLTSDTESPRRREAYEGSTTVIAFECLCCW